MTDTERTRITATLDQASSYLDERIELLEKLEDDPAGAIELMRCQFGEQGAFDMVAVLASVARVFVYNRKLDLHGKGAL